MKNFISLLFFVLIAIACTRKSANLHVGEAALGQSFLPSFDNGYENNSVAGKIEDDNADEPDSSLQISNYVRFIFQEKSTNNQNNVMWFATYGRGAGRYDHNAKVTETSKKFEYYSRENGLAGNEVRDIFQDSKGNVWFATNGGVTRYSDEGMNGKTFTTFTKRNGLISDNAWTILEDRNGIFWFGTDNGVCTYDPALPPIKESFKSFDVPYADISNFSGAYPAPKLINKIFQDKTGKIWFGTNGNGIFYLDPATSSSGNELPELKHYSTKQGLCNNFIHGIYEDSKGTLWFSSRFGGVSRYNAQIAVKKHSIFTNFTKEDGLSSNFIWNVFEDKDGNFWFATAGGGVDFVNDTASISTTEKRLLDTKSLFKNYDTVNGLSSDYVQNIMQDKKGNLWFATGDGISRFVPGAKYVAEWILFTSYPSKRDGC